jgi:hypothetical protein
VVKEKDKCYLCGECEMGYKDKKKACECEDHCKKHKACNLEIMKHSINNQKEEK